MHVFMPMRAFQTFVVIRVTSKSSLSQAFCISEMVEHYTLELLSSVTLYRSISEPMFIEPLRHII
jgi:hypothetical protein